MMEDASGSRTYNLRLIGFNEIGARAILTQATAASPTLRNQLIDD